MGVLLPLCQKSGNTDSFARTAPLLTENADGIGAASLAVAKLFDDGRALVAHPVEQFG